MAELQVESGELVLHLSGVEKAEGVIEVGTVQGLTKRLFAAVHHDTPRGLRICLQGSAYDQWIVGCADPEAVATRLGLPK